MVDYKITISKVYQREDERYSTDITLYEQIVSGDETIISAVVGTVLDYTTLKLAQPLSVEGRKPPKTGER